MKTNSRKSTIFTTLLAVFAVLLLSCSTTLAKESDEVAGVSTADVAVAVITAISPETREITLKDGDKEFTYTAGPEVRNFDQLKRGDIVLVGYFAGLVFDIKPADGQQPARKDVIAVQRAAEGDKPGVAIQHTVHAVGTVEDINKEERTITIKGPEHTVILKVSKAVDLEKVKKGDRVDATYTTLYAIQVEPAPKVSGTISIKSTSVAAGIGYEWGHGTMTMYDGTKHTFKIKGLSIIDVGISTIEATGEVYHLVEAKDLEGTYVSGQTGATFIAGGAASAMKNDKGVVLKLKSVQKGLKFTLAPGGMTITDVK